MTPDQWKTLQSELGQPFGHAELLVDGYKITLEVQRERALKYCIAIFIDGWFRGEWARADCEERRRFLSERKVSMWTPAQKKKLTAGMGKRAVAKYFPDLDKTASYWLPYWPSVTALRRHLVKANQSIELVKLGV